MDEQNKSRDDKKKIITPVIIIALTMAVIVFIIWLTLRNFGKPDGETDDYSNLNNKVDINNRIDTLYSDFNLGSLKTSYRGIRESMDGSIEAVFLIITEVNEVDNTFTYTVNIATNKRISGIGSIDFNKHILQSDMLGDLLFELQSDVINLRSVDESANNKYNLVQER
ncbi:MAG: hypothetical protein WC313_04710 [Candidatus Kapaibacterium sp.]|jgi:hypothetical protein|nr:hypothetical protein [Candidatus Kapabacteria bacterium]